VTIRGISVATLLSLFEHIHWINGVTIKKLKEYEDMFCFIQSASGKLNKSGMSIATIRRGLNDLMDAGLVAEGVRNRNEKSYYLTDKGIKAMKAMSECRCDTKKAVDDMKSRYEKLKSQR
jgi:DNA-binding transcriptional ArsR family regulator